MPNQIQTQSSITLNNYVDPSTGKFELSKPTTLGGHIFKILLGLALSFVDLFLQDFSQKFILGKIFEDIQKNHPPLEGRKHLVEISRDFILSNSNNSNNVMVVETLKAQQIFHKVLPQPERSDLENKDLFWKDLFESENISETISQYKSINDSKHRIKESLNSLNLPSATIFELLENTPDLNDRFLAAKFIADTCDEFKKASPERLQETMLHTTGSLVDTAYLFNNPSTATSLLMLPRALYEYKTSSFGNLQWYSDAICLSLPEVHEGTATRFQANLDEFENQSGKHSIAIKQIQTAGHEELGLPENQYWQKQQNSPFELHTHCSWEINSRPTEDQPAPLDLKIKIGLAKIDASGKPHIFMSEVPLKTDEPYSLEQFENLIKSLDSQYAQQNTEKSPYPLVNNFKETLDAQAVQLLQQLNSSNNPVASNVAAPA